MTEMRWIAEDRHDDCSCGAAGVGVRERAREIMPAMEPFEVLTHFGAGEPVNVTVRPSPSLVGACEFHVRAARAPSLERLLVDAQRDAAGDAAGSTTEAAGRRSVELADVVLCGHGVENTTAGAGGDADADQLAEGGATKTYFRAHRVVLSSFSESLACLLNSGMLESVHRAVDMPTVPPLTLARLLLCTSGNRVDAWRAGNGREYC